MNAKNRPFIPTSISAASVRSSTSRALRGRPRPAVTCSADDKGNALGNLSLESYDDVARRKDLLVELRPVRDARPVGEGGADLQACAHELEEPLSLPSSTRTSRTSAGRRSTSPPRRSPSCRLWMDNGAAENNARQADRALRKGRLLRPRSVSTRRSTPTTTPRRRTLRLSRPASTRCSGESCAAGNCHGAAPTRCT